MTCIRKCPGLRLALAASLVLFGAAARADDQDLPSLSLEQLSDVVVTSASRQEERLANAAASIYIISATDLARSGVLTLPEALRLAPNLQVARVDARNYAITARGFNGAFQNKLLVPTDGRSVWPASAPTGNLTATACASRVTPTRAAWSRPARATSASAAPTSPPRSTRGWPAAPTCTSG